MEQRRQNREKAHELENPFLTMGANLGRRTRADDGRDRLHLLLAVLQQALEEAHVLVAGPIAIG